MFDFTWKESRILRRWGAPDFLARVPLVGLLVALLLVAHAGTSLAQSPPVAAYSFDEGSGTTVKDSARNHDGTISGATWASVGKYGSALDFDGVNDLVSIADAADLDLTSNFTLEAWVRPDTITAARPVIAKSESAGGNSGYLLSARYSSNPTGFVASSGTVKSVARPSPLPEAFWSHLAFTSDGTNLRLYVDGKLAATAPAIAAKATAASLVIGYGQVLGGYFDGMIDEVRLYADTLSESEILTDRDTAVGLDQIPVAAYSFDEGSGTTLKDSISNHDGTVSGATWTTGKYGSALDFDGVNDVVSIADAANLDLTSTFTLEAWVRPDTATDWSPVVAKNENPESGYGSGYVLFSQGPGKPRGWLANAGATKAVTGSSALPTNEWSHLAFTSDGTNLRLYVNGSLVGGPGSAGAVGPTASALEIGHWTYLNTYFDGRIDELRIYNEALSETQIQVDRNSRVEPLAPTQVVTTALDTGPTSELVSTVPITSSGIETVVYSLPIPTLKAGEVLRAAGSVQVTNNQTYDVNASVRLVLGSNPSDGGSAVVIPWTRIKQTPKMSHWTLPINGVYRASSNFGSTQYLKIMVKAAATPANPGDTLTVKPNSGRLVALRSAPAGGPMSQPTHELQPQVDPLTQLVTTIPVDSSWQRVMTRKVSPLSYNDLLEISSQLEIQNTSAATVKLESKVTRSGSPSTGGGIVSTLSVDHLSADVPSAHLMHLSNMPVTDPGKPYLNLVVRAVPISGTPSPLIAAGTTGILNVVRHKPNSGVTSAPLLDGTRVEPRIDYNPDISSIPFAPETAPEPKVIASVSLHGGVWKGEMINARGLVTGDLGGGGSAQLLTKIVLADSPTATSGEAVGPFNGDTIPAVTQTHTVVNEGSYVVRHAADVGKYVNLVAQASRAPAFGGEAMSVPAGSLYVTRSKSTSATDEGFEVGLDSDGLDSLYEYEINGQLSASSAIAREGSKSLHVDMNVTEDAGELPGIRRVEARPPDIRSAAGYYGEESWHGFSAYFPNDFKVPHPDPVVYFDGMIDEVRMYGQALSAGQIANDRDGEYSPTPTPIAVYTFNEGSGTTAVDSAGSHNGTIEGATWTSEGRYGSALNFDGLDDSVSIPDASALDLASSSFTLEAWVRPDSLSAWTGTPVISKIDNPNGNKSGYLMRAAAAGTKPNGLLANSGSTINASGSAPLPTATWSHLALSSDGTTLRLYVNGELVTSQAAISVPVTSDSLTIGSSNYNTASSGTWNIFTQLHHIKEELPLIGCPQGDEGGVPISFNIRHYRAGAHTNPGGTQTATPVEDDYIELMFNGGEQNANCEAVNDTQNYVIAPLKRGQWYDFVLHTRWTQFEGTQKNSVSEVWMDGQQVLGNETTPILTPTLSWRGTPESHRNGAYLQFGLYRGPSLEDPSTHHYIDAVRSGDSYSEVAPGQ
jgi:hypothetical protein